LVKEFDKSNYTCRDGEFRRHYKDPKRAQIIITEQLMIEKVLVVNRTGYFGNLNQRSCS